MKFWRQLLSFWWWLKKSVFLSRPFWFIFLFFFWFFFLLQSYLNKSQINGYQGWDEILMITLISSKNIGVYKIMRNTVFNVRRFVYNSSYLKYALWHAFTFQKWRIKNKSERFWRKLFVRKFDVAQKNVPNLNFLPMAVKNLFKILIRIVI